jgi:hypothetical protein
VHARSLSGLRGLVERSLAEVRLEAGMPRLERVSLVEFMEEIEVNSALLCTTDLKSGVAPRCTKADVHASTLACELPFTALPLCCRTRLRMSQRSLLGRPRRHVLGG